MDYNKEGIFYTYSLEKLDSFFVNSGFVQFSDSNGELCFLIFENELESVRQVNDLIFAKVERNIHKGLFDTPNFNVNVHTTRVDEVFKVKRVEASGRSYWIEVSF